MSGVLLWGAMGNSFEKEFFDTDEGDEFDPADPGVICYPCCLGILSLKRRLRSCLGGPYDIRDRYHKVHPEEEEEDENAVHVRVSDPLLGQKN